MFALAEARKARHHKHCNCRMYQKTACSAADALWTAKLNNEIEAIKAHDSEADNPHRPSGNNPRN